MAPALKLALALPGSRQLARRVLTAAAGLLLLLLVCIAALLGGLTAAKQAQSCTTSVTGDPFAGETGSLGGVGGTGITRAELATVRGGRTPNITPGDYLTTAYGPPWGGIQGDGNSTSAGLHLGGQAPKKYFIAVDPSLIAYGSWVYIWPNPFKWKGAFLAADTGGAIVGRRIDFYDWRGRTTQNAWGRTPAQVSSKPNAPGSDTEAPTLVEVDNPATTPAGTTPPDCGDASTDVGGSGAGRKASQIAVQYLGKNARATPFAGFQPPTTQDAWCAWFLTNVWRKAGVAIPVSWFSGYPYQWAAASHPNLILKRPGSAAKTLKLPVGTALMYGSGPESAGTSDHVNMVRSVNPDGTVQIIGGNQDDSHVTSYGPCRLTNGVYAHLTGPGCDGRPIYAIVAPSLDSDTSTPADRRSL